jgi:tetratricopeptide (TPR) repeat protein
MADAIEVRQLAARWTSQHERGVFAALADALRKMGAATEAEAVVRDGLARYPRYLPGYLVLAQLRRDAGDPAGAEAALAAVLALDPDHPVARRQLADLHGTALMPTDVPTAAAEPEPEPASDTDDADLDEPHEPLVTESLALLYHRQGHYDRALEVFEALLAREPANHRLREQRDAVHADLAARRPRPYDAARSGGRSVATWLAAVAAARPGVPQSASAYDAFFQESPPRNAEPPVHQDLEAFQRWLKGLGR